MGNDDISIDVAHSFSHDALDFEFCDKPRNFRPAVPLPSRSSRLDRGDGPRIFGMAVLQRPRFIGKNRTRQLEKRSSDAYGSDFAERCAKPVSRRGFDRSLRGDSPAGTIPSSSARPFLGLHDRSDSTEGTVPASSARPFLGSVPPGGGIFSIGSVGPTPSTVHGRRKAISSGHPSGC